MPGGREQKIAETAERVGADGLLFIGADPDPVDALAGIDVEVVEPEFDERLVQLPRARDRAGEAGNLGLAFDLPLAGLELLSLGIGQGFQIRCLCGRPVGVEKRRTIPAEGRQCVEDGAYAARQPCGFRMELPIEKIFEARVFDPVQIAGCGTESEPVGKMQRRRLLEHR